MIRSFCDCDRDPYGFCPIHDRIALVCKTCETILEDGAGVAGWEAGEDRSVRLQEQCAVCAKDAA